MRCPDSTDLPMSFSAAISACEKAGRWEQALAIIHRHEMAGAEAARWMPGAEAALLAGLIGGTAYLNIHTTAFPAGEIRGFFATAPSRVRF